MKNISSNIISPRITEKGAFLSEKGVYVFNVAKDANKHEIAAAVKAAFKVTPTKIRIAAVRGKKVMTRGTNRVGRTTSGKKAFVYLKEGDKIEIN